jgi:hypothetical protein
LRRYLSLEEVLVLERIKIQITIIYRLIRLTGATLERLGLDLDIFSLFSEHLIDRIPDCRVCFRYDSRSDRIGGASPVF